MMILSFMFVILESCIFENDITQSNSINVVVFAGRNSDTILKKNFLMRFSRLHQNKDVINITVANVTFVLFQGAYHCDEGKEVIFVKLPL